MNCLYNYIGIIGCDAVIPESGLFVNSQPGITTESIAAIAENEQENYLGVWEDIQQRSMRKFSTLVLSRMANKFKIKSILDTVDIGRAIDGATTYAAESKWKGFQVFFNSLNLNSIAQISVQEIVLYLSAISSTTVKIFDIETGQVLFTAVITNKQGFVKLNVGKSFLSTALFIAYDTSTVDQTSLKLPFYQPEHGCACECSCNDCELTIKGAQSNDIENPTTLTYGDELFGLSAVFSIKCGLEKLVCNNKELFTNAWMNLLCAEIMFENMYTSRVNRWTTVDRKKVSELREEYEIAFVGEIDNVIKGLDIHDKCCVDCQDLVKIQESIM